MESALIEAVEKRRCLFGKAEPNYCNRTYVSSEWKKVAREVGCNEDGARKRWKSLRDYFLKLSREAPKSGSAGGMKRKWFLFDRMLFLKSCMSDRKTTTNMAPPTPDDDTAIDEKLSPLSPSSLPSFASGSQATSPSNCGAIGDTGAAVLSPEDKHQDEELETPIKKFRPTSTTPRMHKNPFPQHRRPVGEFDAELLEAAKRIGSKEEKELSAEEHFFKNLVPKLQNMNPIDRMECQQEIDTVVLKYMKKSGNLSACGISYSDMHFQPVHSPPATDTSAYDLLRYQYSTNNTSETTRNISTYPSYSQYQQYPDC